MAITGGTPNVLDMQRVRDSLVGCPLGAGGKKLLPNKLKLVDSTTNAAPNRLVLKKSRVVFREKQGTEGPIIETEKPNERGFNNNRAIRSVSHHLEQIKNMRNTKALED